MGGTQSALFNFEMSGAHASLRFWECTQIGAQKSGAIELVVQSTYVVLNSHNRGLSESIILDPQQILHSAQPKLITSINN